MEHSKAVEMNAAERYFLGELSVAERDEFEAHYFDCAVCAADVKSVATLTDNSREVFRAEAVPNPDIKPVPRPGGSWFGWMRPAYAFGALAILIATIGYQNLVTIPQLRNSSAQDAQPLASLSLMTAGTRGGQSAEITVAAKRPFGIYLDIPAGAGFMSYTCEIRTETGEEKLAVPVSPEQAKDSVQLLVPGGLLSAGKYVVSVRGRKQADTAEEEIARYPFILKTP